MIVEKQSLMNSFGDDLLLKALQTAHEATAVYINEDLLIRFANDAMLRFWGKDKSVIGKTLAQAVPELEGQPFIELLKRVWHTGITYSAFDTPADLIVDGELKTFYFDFEYRAIQDEFQKTWCIIHSSKDVTQRREHLLKLEEKEEEEQALNEEMAATVEELLSTNEELNQSLILLADSREHIKTIIEQAPVGIALLEGDDLKINIANSAILKIWGRQEWEVLGKAHKIARPELDGQPVNNWLDAAYQTGEPKINNEFRVMLYNDGQLREAFVNSIYQPIFSSHGEITGVLVILEEITEQILRQREHDKAQQMFTMAVDAGGLATFFYEPETNLFSGNETLKSWFGLTPDEKIDLSIAIGAVMEEDRKRVSEAISFALNKESDGHYAIEYRLALPGSDHIRTVQAIGRTHYDKDGNPNSLNGTLRDVTEQKKDEQRKDDFISMVSHELKTPLTSLNAYLQLLQRKANLAGDEPLLSTLDKALKQTRSMGSMINGFLNVSRLDSGKLAIDLMEFDLRDLLKDVEDELHATIHTHRVNINSAESVMIYADRDKIAQVIYNLTGNAVKYSPMGSEINVSYKQLGNDIHISVEDQGLGIAEEDQDQIFERYYRVKNNKTGSIAGFGIGLYLCKEIVERHQGKIFLESKADQGAKFTFVIPAAK